VVRVYDARTGRETVTLKGPEGLCSPAFSPDGSWIAAEGGDGVIRMYDARTGQEVQTFKGTGGLRFPAFSPDGARIAGADGSVLRVYDARTGQEVFTLKPEQPARLAGAVFSPDGSRIAPGRLDDDGVVRVYDARTGEKTLVLKAQARLYGPRFSPDGTRAVTFGDDRVLRVFETRAGQEVLALRDSAGLGSPRFSPDGSRITATGPAWGGGVVRVWEAPKDVGVWQARRREGLADGLPDWHRQQSLEAAEAGRWFGAAFHLTRLIEAEPEVGQHRCRRGEVLLLRGQAERAVEDFAKALQFKDTLTSEEAALAHAELGQWDDAARLYGEVVKGPSAAPNVWNAHAMLLLRRGDRPGYARACASMLQRFGKTSHGPTAIFVAWTCALAPDALTDLSPAVALARGVVTANPKIAAVRNTFGAVLYRAGKHQDAVTQLNEAVKLDPAGDHSFGFLFLAMAHHRLGQAGEAKKWLDEAVKANDRRPPAGWHVRLTWQLLRREAEQVLKEKPAKSSE
jgi:WD40 repeat protein